MTIRLQKTGHRESRYERPTQKWVCGWTADGNPCQLGPDHGGRCTAAAESHCTPTRQGERWRCARLPVFGGPCDAGPLPDGNCCRPTPAHPICQPRLNIRARRVRLVRTLAALTLGLLTMLVAGPWSTWFVSPGELTSAHATIAGADGAAPDCAACHRAEQAGGADWMRAVFSPASSPSDSDRCLSCHFGADRDALLVHGIPPEQLHEKTEQARQRTGEAADGAGAGSTLLALASIAGPPPTDSGGRMACASCHAEHRGREHSLTRLDDVRCQSCHVSRFAGFAADHPEFRAPAAPGEGIRFDHAEHKQANFGELEFNCSRCHTPDGEARTMLLRPYELSCSGCHHQGQSDHHGERNIKAGALGLVQLPGMEFDEPPADWPEDAALGGPLTPLLLMLIGGDPQALEALESLEAEQLEWEPYDWWPDDEQLKLDLVAAIERAIRDLGTGSRSTIASRLASTLGSGEDDPTLIAWVEQLEPSRLALAIYLQRYLTQLEGDPEPSTPWELPAGESGWQLVEEDAAVAYKPASHADPLLKSWIDALAAHAAPSGDGEDPSFVERLRSQAFEQATSEGFFFKACLRCHVTKPVGDAPARVHWKALGHAAKSGGYTKFNHRPHLTLKSSDACTDCHELAVVVEGAPERAQSRGLFTHRKSQCVSCHTPTQARSDCLTCHEYHPQRDAHTAGLGSKPVGKQAL